MNHLTQMIAAGALSLCTAAPAFAGDVVVTIYGVQAGTGSLYVSLQKQDEFLQNSGSYGAFVKQPKAGEQQVVIKDVLAGDYSISVWHDTNGDGKFTQTANGMPLDGWTMVNASALRGAPVWGQVKFTVPSTTVATKLAMIYPQQ